MKKKALIKVLAAPEDLEKLAGVLEHLGRNGVAVSADSAGIGKKDMVLAVLSDRFYSDEGLKTQLFDQLAVGAENILPLNMEDTPVPEEIMNLLFARNIIMASGRSDAQMAERILSAIPEKKNPVPKILVGAVTVLALLGGLFLWRSAGQQEPEPAVAVEEPVPNPLGITEKELAEIRDVIIIGDTFAYFTYDDYTRYGHWPEIYDFAYEAEDGDGRHWYSTEDGHAFAMARYDDLRFLEQMPNLSMIRMVLVDVDVQMLPDLSSSKKLSDVVIADCSMTDISWLAGSSVSYLDISGTDIGDYGPLTDCTYLQNVTIDGRGEYRGDFSSFAPPSLVELNLYGMEPGEDLSALADCRHIAYLRMEGLQIRDLDFVKEMKSLKTLEVRNMPQLQDISGVAELTDLRELAIIQCDGVRDYMPVNACRNLERIQLERWNWIYADSAFLNGLTKLRDIGLFGLNLNNMEFLAEVNQQFGLNLGFCGDIQDYSGLAHVKKYQWIHVNPKSNGGRFGDYSLVAPYLRDSAVAEMELYNCTNVDLTALPNVTQRLVITGGVLEDLTGLGTLPVQCLELRDMQYLRSLKGMEELSKLETGGLELDIMGCFRLKDYSALDGFTLRILKLCGMYDLPDFSRFGVRTLRLESIEDLEDLSCLETLDRDAMYTFEFLGLDDLKDLSILRNFKGNSLYVPPQVADQAEELVKDGNFRFYEVRYPDSGWSPMNEEVTLLSMEELETLPRAVLRRVSRVWIAGDEIIDPNLCEVREEWHGNRPTAVIYDRETGRSRQLGAGSIHDFALLSDLTNLRELRLFVQPIISLEGIQDLSSLACFEAMCCTGLQDVSALYTLQDLEEISFQMSPVDNIQGVQNLPKLRHLNVASTYVTDLSPLAECDFSYAQQVGGFCLITSNTSITDLSPIAGIPSFQHLNLCGYPPELWMQYVDENTPVRGYCGPMGSDAFLEQFVQQHPELEEMHIERGYELTDLTPLLELSGLRYVHIWDRPYAAVQSLEGAQRNFQLDVD